MFRGALQRCSGKTWKGPPKTKVTAVNSFDWPPESSKNRPVEISRRQPVEQWTQNKPHRWHDISCVILVGFIEIILIMHGFWHKKSHKKNLVVGKPSSPIQSPTNNPWGVFQLRSFHDPKKSSSGGQLRQVTRGASPEMAPMTKKSEGKLGTQGGGDDDGCDCDDSLSLSFFLLLLSFA